MRRSSAGTRASRAATWPGRPRTTSFETPEEETEKFHRRLLPVGASDWPRGAAIAELFCGRGNGLRALAALGFTDLRGVDLSEELLASYDGPRAAT